MKTSLGHCLLAIPRLGFEANPDRCLLGTERLFGEQVATLSPARSTWARVRRLLPFLLCPCPSCGFTLIGLWLLRWRRRRYPLVFHRILTAQEARNALPGLPFGE